MKSSRILCSLGLALCLAAAVIPCAAQDFHVTLEGFSVRSHEDSTPIRLATPLAQPYWAVGAGPYLVIADRTDPDNLVVVARMPLPSAIVDMDVVGNKLFLALGVPGMAIVDVTNPLSPILLGSYTRRKVQALAASTKGDYVYCVNGDPTLNVVDASDPSRPKLHRSKQYKNANFYDVLVTGRTLIAAAGPKGVIVYSIENPADPIRAKRVKKLRATTRLALNEKLLAATDDDLGLVLIDFPEWNTPSVKGNVPAVTNALDCAFVAATPTYILVAEGANGYRVVDVTNPDAPVSVAQPATPSPVTSVSGARPKPYLGCGDSGLQVVDLTNPAQPVTQQVLSGLPSTGPLDVSGNVVYVGANGSFQTWDYSDSAHPTQLGTLQLPSSATDISVFGTLLFVSCQGQGVAIYDVSTPASPHYLSFFTVAGGLGGQVSVLGNLMAVAAGSQGAFLVDISNPDNPTQVGTWTEKNGYVSGVAFSSSTLLWAMESTHGLHSLNVTTPSAPVVLDKASSDWNFGRIYVSGTTVYQAASYLGLIPYDGTDPSKIDKKDALTTISATTIALRGTDLLLADGGGGLRLYDISVDPLHPAQIAWFEAPGFSWAAGFLTDGTPVLASREGGLWSLGSTSCAGPVLLQPCDAQAVSPFHAAMFSWLPQTGADNYRVQLSVEPGFPNSDKTHYGAKGKGASWVPTDNQWNWIKKRADKGKTIYWRVLTTIGSNTAHSETRTVALQ